MEIEHSTQFTKVKYWYDLKMWDDKRIRNAVEKGYITEAEYTEITGNEY